MTLADNTSTHFSEMEHEELGEYRPINRTALVALLLGFASALALIHPALYIVPALAAGAAFLALRQLSTSEDKQSGRPLALVGLCLAVLFASWSVARQTTRQEYLFRHARQNAETWLDLMKAGKYLEAHQLSLPEVRRLERGVSLEKHYKPRNVPDLGQMNEKLKEPGTDRMKEMMEMMEPSLSEEFNRFLARPIVGRLKNLGPSLTYRFRSNLRISTSSAMTEQIEQEFEASGTLDGKPTSFIFKIIQERLPVGAVSDWRIDEVTNL